MKTGLITTDTYKNHNTGNGHPEKIDRVTAIIDNFKKIDNKNLIWKKPNKFDEFFLNKTHSIEYINHVKRSFPKKGLVFLDGDTIVSPGSKDATKDAVGSIITAIDGVQNKEFKNAFCAVRPPGHHAEKEKAMGFCIYNNVAVGANYLIEKYKYKKIAIIDFDVHHGNGTQDIFYDNEKVLYVSTHQYPYYPGSGSNKENGKFNNAFCAVRPPGHHAEKDKAMGFCIYNNIAVGANYLIEKYKYKKIAIIDFDVHHGNGTQDIFYDNEKVLYVSTHQYPYYPGSGSNKENGKFNNVLNIPLEAGTTSEVYLNAYENVLTKIKHFKPEFLLFSAGFDAHINDPLAQIGLSTEDYYKITKRTLETSKSFCNGRVVSILEGGYDLKALQNSTQRHVDALLEFN